MSQVWFPFIFIALCNQYHQVTEAQNCTHAGRFPNTLSNDCRGYTMCLKVLADFTRIDLVCPEHSIYSHLENQCTNITSYQCLPEHDCTQVGDFPNPSVTDCGSYISCAEGLGSIVTPRLTECPTGMIYSPTDRACVNNTMFQCELTTTTTEPPKVFEISIKHSPETASVNSSNNVDSIKTCYIIFLILMLHNVIKYII